jgi:hypothetical protein
MYDDKVTALASRLGLDVDLVNKIYGQAHADGQVAAGIRTKVRAGDIRLGPELYERAYSQGMSLSALLEEEDPSHEYKAGDEFYGMDAFERQLALAGLRTKSDHMRGIYASKVGDFFDSKNKPGASALLPEFIYRTARAVTYGGEQDRFYASSNPVSEVLYPTYLSQELRAKKIQPQIPLSAVIAQTTNIDGAAYKAFYLTDDATQRNMLRVGEGSEVPTAKLTGGEHTINLKKYGRRLLSSYEAVRRMQLDLFGHHISLLAAQAETDKVTTVIDILLNGDGNSGTTPTNSTQTGLGGTVNVQDAKTFLTWMMLWTSPYRMDTVLARSDHALDLMCLNSGSANNPMNTLAMAMGFGGFSALNQGANAIRVGWDSNVTDATLLGFDSRTTVEMITEIGGNIVETNKIIGQQLNEIVFTEVLGFAILDANALRTLTLSS